MIVRCGNCDETCLDDDDLTAFGIVCCSHDCLDAVLDEAAFEERCGRWFDDEEFARS